MNLKQNFFKHNKHSGITVFVFFSAVLIFAAIPVRLKADSEPDRDFFSRFDSSSDEDIFGNETEKNADDDSGVFDKTSESGTTDGQNEPEKSADALQYALHSRYSLQKGGKLYAAMHHRLFSGFVQLESPLPAPYLQFSVKNFGLSALPFADLQRAYPEKPIPRLFLGTGSLSFGSFLKTMRRTGFSALRASYTGIKIPKKLFLGISTGEKRLCYGAELSGRHWTTAFFAVPEKKQRGMQYGVYGSGIFDGIAPYNAAIRIEHSTVFIPEITKKQPVLPYRKKKQRYHTVTGIGFTARHPNISFEAAGASSITADKAVSGAVKTELDFFYRYAGMNSGFSYTHPGHFGWDAVVQKERISAFVQPYTKAGWFSLRTLYAFYLKNTKKTPEPHHAYSVALHANHTSVRWNAGWHYQESLHTVKADLSIVSSAKWFTGLRWFEKVRIGGQMRLQDKAENPVIVTTYGIEAASVFAITENITCGIKGRAAQSALPVKKRRSSLYWKPFEYGGSVFFTAKKHGIDKTHTFRVSISGKNREPFYDISLGYSLTSD